jgi:hypothetical protein
MKVTLEHTTMIVKLSGIDCRIWEGTTEKGVKVHAFIPRISIRNGDDASEFEADLKNQKPPSIDTGLTCRPETLRPERTNHGTLGSHRHRRNERTTGTAAAH